MRRQIASAFAIFAFCTGYSSAFSDDEIPRVGAQVSSLSADSHFGKDIAFLRLSSPQITLISKNRRSAVTVFDVKDISMPLDMAHINGNGSDQTQPAVKGDTIWIYFVWSQTGGISAIASKNDPSVGPTLSQEFTHYAPAFPMIVESSLRNFMVRGNNVYYVDAPSRNVCGWAEVKQTNPPQTCPINERVEVDLADVIPVSATEGIIEYDAEVNFNKKPFQGGMITHLGKDSGNVLNLSLYAFNKMDGGGYAPASVNAIANTPLSKSERKLWFSWNRTIPPENDSDSQVYTTIYIFVLGYKF